MRPSTDLALSITQPFSSRSVLKGAASVLTRWAGARHIIDRCFVARDEIATRYFDATRRRCNWFSPLFDIFVLAAVGADIEAVYSRGSS